MAPPPWSEVDQEWKKHPSRRARIVGQLTQNLERAGLAGGRALEIGGRKHPYRPELEALGFEYAALDIEPHEDALVADITGCPEIPDESFDLILSVDVFEHIDRPWLAAAEISRLLRPGGVSYTSTLFSWRYHPCPIDYWRFSPACLTFLFSDLETLDSGFDLAERRRDIRAKPNSKHQVPVDAMGGWREHWRVHHVGRRRSA